MFKNKINLKFKTLSNLFNKNSNNFHLKSLTSCSFSTKTTPSSPSSSSSAATNTTLPTNINNSLFNKLWGVDSCNASIDYKNRWLMTVPAFFTHMSIGKNNKFHFFFYFSLLSLQYLSNLFSFYYY